MTGAVPISIPIDPLLVDALDRLPVVQWFHVELPLDDEGLAVEKDAEFKVGAETELLGDRRDDFFTGGN